MSELRRFLGIVIAVAALIAGCGGDGAGEGHEEQAPLAVEAVPARSGSLPLAEELNGTVRAENQVAIRPEIEAPIVAVLVKSGDAVSRGQALVRLDAEALGDLVRQAEANVRLAEGSAAEARARVAEREAQVTRTRALAAEELVSDLDLETQEAQLAAVRAQAEQAGARTAQAQAAAEERRSALGKAVVRSPIAGHVGQRNAEVGMLATPGTTLFLVGNLERLVVDVALTEEMLGRVAPGTPVEIASPALAGAPIRAAISRISPFLEEGSFSTTAEIDLDNSAGRLNPGMFVTVAVLYGETERATLVPASALWEEPETGRRGVYVIAEAAGLAEPAAAPGPDAAMPPELRAVAFRPVDVLAEGRGAAGVRGLEPGEWVVTVGQHLFAGAGRDAGEKPGGGEDEPGAADGAADPGALAARVRPTTWDRVLELQGLQREDLLRGFLERQQRAAEAFGAEIPDDPEAVDRMLEGEAGGGEVAAPRPDGGARQGGG